VISTMRTHIDRSTTKLAFQFSLLALMLILCVAPYLLPAQAPAAPATQAASAPTQSTPPAAATTPNHAVPSWAYPGSATHVQVAPPPDFHRPSRNFDTPIGIFQGQSDIGSALVPGSASYDAATAVHHPIRRLQRLVHARRVPLPLEEDVRRRFAGCRYRVSPTRTVTATARRSS
jgi:hypothetical protein